MADTEEPEARHADESRSAWRRIAGDGSHIGFWTLPVFIATALAGAVIAGAIANVYYAQQVAGLEEETRAARTVAEVAAEEIDAARQEALDAISEQVDGVRDALEVARPLPDPAAAGVVALRVELTPPAPSPDPSPAPAPPPPADPTPAPDQGGAGTDGDAQGAPLPAPDPASPDADATDGVVAATVRPLGTTDGEEPATGQPAQPATQTGPPPEAAGARFRNAVGFAVAVADGQAFIATSFGAIADPGTVDGVAPAVTVATPIGSARGVVHAWDESRGVAVVRVALPDVPILPWRPEAVALDAGDVVVLAAVTPGLVGVQLPGRLGAVAAETLVTDLPVDPVFDGAPLVDNLGRVIALQSSTAAPFGAGSNGAIAARTLCIELISGCDLLEQVDESDADAQDEGADEG